MTRALSAAIILTAMVATTAAAGPWADTVVDYEPGDLDAGDLFTVSTAALGQPARTTVGYRLDGESYVPFEESVRITVPANQTYPDMAPTIVKIGNGGYLTVGFENPVTNDPGNPFGIDLLVFGNLGLASSDWPDNKTIADPMGVFGGQLGTILVSADMSEWYEVVPPGEMLPTHAFQSDEGDAFATGAAPTDYCMPVDPSIGLDDLAGLTLSQARALYGTAGGGLGIDLSSLLDGSGQAASLEEINYVRIEGATNAIDGFAVVPEPATMGLLGVGLAVVALRRRRRS